MSRLRSHLTYANVMATIAVFAALGGTSYAVAQLPRNSVGTKQIRAKAVGKSELRSSAVRSKHINNGSVALRDISLAARRALQGQRGPTGPPGPAGSPALLAAAVSSGGGIRRGVGTVSSGAEHGDATGTYAVEFNRDVTTCFAAASLSAVDGGSVTDPQNGEITTNLQGRVVTVRTRNSSGAPTDLPFHLIVAC